MKTILTFMARTAATKRSSTAITSTIFMTVTVTAPTRATGMSATANNLAASRRSGCHA